MLVHILPVKILVYSSFTSESISSHGCYVSTPKCTYGLDRGMGEIEGLADERR